MTSVDGLGEENGTPTACSVGWWLMVGAGLF
jgi:hypothetical protein